ncbi:CBO0543 family protein [Pontibacillus marinus]|uniref:Uncharacterized protein n=1 Tax=Pontibacillus marinus BH030004 = DSM 16465 TaxID=1385511 RepID=A0A0A5G194_9BACI|nr:CBO0543 family protein [Pontibacillus marinus]KGX84873.1 hypothetical protein N783_15800 [Pontibacillus marinus BH030004 = DSM 16465]
MKRQSQTTFLTISTMVSLFLLPFALFKRSFKDWIIVYLVSIIGNSFADRYFISEGYLHYKIRPFRRRYKIHLPFDYLYYPLLLLYYNQWTLNSKPLGIVLKLFPFVIPQVMIESIAARNTKLITWRKGWTWYHSFLTLLIKFLLCRMIIGIVRVLNKGEVSTN